MGAVLAAILWLAPHVGAERADQYAGLITGHAEDAGIDPMLVVAIIYIESRFRSGSISRTNDYGLMQVHVSKTTYRRYLGREHLLLDPDRNIKCGISLLKYWKSYHERICTSNHRWWSHFNHGKRILRRGERAGYGASVNEVYQLLRTRFQGNA